MTNTPAALPLEWISRVRTDFESDPDLVRRILEGASTPRWRGLRINRRRGDFQETLDELRKAGLEGDPTDIGPWVRMVDEDTARAVAKHELATSGRVVLQSLSSILAVLAADPQPGERVLDLCAAPGGKSALLADLVDGDLELTANDRSRARSHRMKRLLDLLGVDARIRTGPGERFDPREDASFDRVLVDAPCSGEGRFRTDDADTFDQWSPKAVRRLASTQKSLLHAAIRLVRPGGVVIYSTCTLGATENEAVVRRAIDRYGSGPTGVQLDPLPPTLPSGVGLLDLQDVPNADEAVRRWVVDPEDPGLGRALDGFFVARLRRRPR